MAIDATEVRVGVTGRLFAGPVGTAFPADVATTLNAAFVDLGLATTDGLAIGTSTDITDINAWQTFSPVRRVVTGRTTDFKFTLMQTNGATLKLAFGGGTITTAGSSRLYTPPAAGVLDERAFVFEVTDGTVIDRFMLTRGIATLDGDIVYRKDEAVQYSFTIGGLATGTESPWTHLTNNADILADA